MFVVINIDPGSTLNELMSFMTQKAITFSVTDQLSRLCERSGDRRETCTQTEDCSEPLAKKARYNGETDYGSPCSSATPSEPIETGTVAKRTDNATCASWDAQESTVLRNLIKTEMEKNVIRPNMTVKEEPEEASVEDEMGSSDFMQNQLIQALFPKNQNGAMNQFVTLDDNDSLEGDGNHLEGLPSTFPLSDGSPASAIRYKPAYASTKRGVCQVCNREVSLITTHRRRHAITHLGFKTLKCALCHKFFSRQDLATGHFKKDHPNDEFSPFMDTMSEDDERQLVMMLGLCFPEENALRKRNKDGKKVAVEQ